MLQNSRTGCPTADVYFQPKCTQSCKAHSTKYILFTYMTFALLWFTSIWLYCILETWWYVCHPSD